MKLRNLTKTAYKDVEYYEYPHYFAPTSQTQAAKVSEIHKKVAKVEKIAKNIKKMVKKPRFYEKKREFEETCAGFFEMLSKVNESTRFPNKFASFPAKAPRKLELSPSLSQKPRDCFEKSDKDEKKTNKSAKSLYRFKDEFKTHSNFEDLDVFLKRDHGFFSFFAFF